jgi:type VI secretion system secreted protein Hcp
MNERRSFRWAVSRFLVVPAIVGASVLAGASAARPERAGLEGVDHQIAKVPSNPVSGPWMAFMEVSGATMGSIPGSSTRKGHQNEIEVYGVRHEVSWPYDPESGQPTDARVHNPVIINKLLDKASPKLFEACAGGEPLAVTIKWYRITSGAEQLYFTTILTDALIVSAKPTMPNVLDAPSYGNFQHLEEISFTYGSIRWTWVPDQIVFDDTWAAAPF